MEKRIDKEEGTLYYEIIGDGLPLLFIHGGPG